ncbi:hypothetical protein GCM10025865_02730 [Paraoerskovia sediminicola]|uniref:PIN domain-containing protein n=1 Tax=Paraoerskovia sediminicola TaxID=1138587 RepID=A0ABM8FYZ0_9CELL|nr:hypothetical protein GCM10025865_02730 [Paraoerskovia sediminicola]
MANIDGTSATVSDVTHGTTSSTGADGAVAVDSLAPDAGPPGDVRRTFVVDTSVLLSDPRAIFRFAEHDVVLPVVVITELEGKRHHAELGYFARNALRMLDDLRIEHGSLHAPVSAGEAGGTIRVELNHTDSSVLPAGFRLGDNDTRILSVAANLAAEGNDVTVVSKDLPMRVKASAVGLRAEEYRAELAVDSGWTGMSEIDVADEQMAQLWEHESIELASSTRWSSRTRARCAATPDS